ncbi:MAG: hypothetical protein M3044_12845 [Thermoproteota archaeon]|nr:hypothetical protein [Thermoproteota archaeon]
MNTVGPVSAIRQAALQQNWYKIKQYQDGEYYGEKKTNVRSARTTSNNGMTSLLKTRAYMNLISSDGLIEPTKNQIKSASVKDSRPAWLKVQDRIRKEG